MICELAISLSRLRTHRGRHQSSLRTQGVSELPNPRSDLVSFLSHYFRLLPGGNACAHWQWWRRLYGGASPAAPSIYGAWAERGRAGRRHWSACAITLLCLLKCQLQLGMMVLICELHAPHPHRLAHTYCTCRPSRTLPRTRAARRLMRAVWLKKMARSRTFSRTFHRTATSVLRCHRVIRL